MTESPTPLPRPAAGDPQQPAPDAPTLTEAVPPRCPTRTREYRGGRVVREGFPAEQISTVLADDADSVVWLDLHDPDEQDLQVVVHEFGLHPLAVEDAVHEHQRPKIDRYATHLFANAYAVEVDDATGELVTSEISMFITRRAFITVRKTEFDVDTLVRRWDLDVAPAADATVSYLLYGLLDAVVDSQYAAVQTLDTAAEDLETALWEPQPGVDIRHRGFRLRRAVADLRRVVAPMQDVVGTLMRADLKIATDALLPYYHDVLDHVQRTAESVDSTRDLIVSILDANLTEQGNQLNEITKKLASWAAIIAVPTAVTGFYGQNVPYPGFGTHGGVISSVIIIVLLAGGVYALLRRQHWL